MADPELEEAVGLMGMNWEDVDELFQKALVTNLEDLYEIGASDNFDYRQLLGSEDCKLYADSILQIRGFVAYLRNTLRVDMDADEEAVEAQEWSTIRPLIRLNGLRRCITRELYDLPIFHALMDAGEVLFMEMRAHARGLPPPIPAASTPITLPAPALSSSPAVGSVNLSPTTPSRNLSTSFEEQTIHSEDTAQTAHQTHAALNDAALADQELRSQAAAAFLKSLNQNSTAP